VRPVAAARRRWRRGRRPRGAGCATPSLVFGLQGAELVDGVGPAPRPRPAIPSGAGTSGRACRLARCSRPRVAKVADSMRPVVTGADSRAAPLGVPGPRGGCVRRARGCPRPCGLLLRASRKGWPSFNATVRGDHYLDRARVYASVGSYAARSRRPWRTRRTAATAASAIASNRPAETASPFDRVNHEATATCPADTSG